MSLPATTHPELNSLHNEKGYLSLMRHILQRGTYRQDRTGTGTYSVFGTQIRFDLTGHKLPLLTTKLLHTRSIIHENLWFIAGDTNIRYLKDNNVRIWDEWADENGDLGPVYGEQWRRRPHMKKAYSREQALDLEKRGYRLLVETEIDGLPFYVYETEIDQLGEAIGQLHNSADSRRILVDAWNPGDVPEMALPPCHCLFQFYSKPLDVYERAMLGMKDGLISADKPLGKPDPDELDALGIPRRGLSCQLYQRSADVFLGVPFNIASYSMLTHAVANVTGHAALEFIHTMGDTHLYANHLEQAHLQLTRAPRPAPKLVLPHRDSIDDFRFDDFKIQGYNPAPAIKAPVAV